MPASHTTDEAAAATQLFDAMDRRIDVRLEALSDPTVRAACVARAHLGRAGVRIDPTRLWAMANDVLSEMARASPEARVNEFALEGRIADALIKTVMEAA
ncbi:MAG: hypothetical protein ABWZ88_12180 [Variovorax sp.]